MNVGHLITCNSSTTASPVLSTHFPVRLALGTKSCSILYWIRLTSFLPKNIFNHLQIKHTWRCILPVFVNFSLFRNLFLLLFPPQKLYSASIFLWSKEYGLGIVSHGICRVKLNCNSAVKDTVFKLVHHCCFKALFFHIFGVWMNNFPHKIEFICQIFSGNEFSYSFSNGLGKNPLQVPF